MPNQIIICIHIYQQMLVPHFSILLCVYLPVTYGGFDMLY